MSKKKSPKTVKKRKAQPKDKLASKVKEALMIQGFPLEVYTYRKFLEKGWDAELEAMFTDIPPKPGQEAREWRKLLARGGEGYPRRFIDIKAENRIWGTRKPPAHGNIGLVVECKSHQTIPWVFYEEEKVSGDYEKLKHFSFGERSLFSLRRKVAPADESRRDCIQASSHHTAHHHSKAAQAGHIVPLAKGQARDSLYEACMTSISALEYQFAMHASMERRGLLKMENGERGFRFWRWYPVVVFAGNLFTIEFIDDNEFNPVPTNYVQLRFETGIREYLIDIIQSNYLEQYIALLDSELSRLQKALST